MNHEAMIDLTFAKKEIETSESMQRMLIDLLDCKDVSKLDSFYECYTKHIIDVFKNTSPNDIAPLLRQLLKLIAHLSIYHKSEKNGEIFIHKLLLFFLKNDTITRPFVTERELIDLFKINKLLLLYLLENNIISITSIINVFKPVNEYFVYFDTLLFFSPEIKNLSIINEIRKFDWASNFIDSHCNDIPRFKEWRLNGGYQNDFTRLIKEDSIDDFIDVIERTNINLQDNIKKKTIKENDTYLSSKSLRPIEYASYFGSVKIFKYLLHKEKVLFNNQIVECAIHGRNYEIIHILEEKNIKIDRQKCLIEAIKCHHNEIVDHFFDDLPVTNDIISAVLFSQNYYLLEKYVQKGVLDLEQNFLLFSACENGNYDMINILAMRSKEMICEYQNKKIIF